LNSPSRGGLGGHVSARDGRPVQARSAFAIRICRQKTFILGKLHYSVLYSLALDIEYDTHLHFETSEDGILVGVRRLSCEFPRVIEIPLYIRSKLSPNKSIHEEWNKILGDVCRTNLPCLVWMVPFQYSPSLGNLVSQQHAPETNITDCIRMIESTADT
jgi:hypothetical protein